MTVDKLALWFLHSSVNVYCLALRLCSYLVKSWLNVLGIILSSVKPLTGSVIHVGDNKKPSLAACDPSSVSLIQRDGRALSKIPSHLGVLVVEDSLSFSDLAKIAVWCIFLGIPYISIYDRLGVVKQNHAVLHKEVKELKKRYSTGSDLADVNIHLHTSIKKPQKLSDTFGKNTVHIRLLSLEDGRQNLVECTRELSRCVKERGMKLSDIEPATVDCLLKESWGIPDPEMVVRFGTTESLMGFLPWQIRLTEFISVPSHHHIDYASFYDVLQSFAQTNQRFGK